MDLFLEKNSKHVAPPDPAGLKMLMEKIEVPPILQSWWSKCDGEVYKGWAEGIILREISMLRTASSLSYIVDIFSDPETFGIPPLLETCLPFAKTGFKTILCVNNEGQVGDQGSVYEVDFQENRHCTWSSSLACFMKAAFEASLSRPAENLVQRLLRLTDHEARVLARYKEISVPPNPEESDWVYWN